MLTRRPYHSSGETERLSVRGVHKDSIVTDVVTGSRECCDNCAFNVREDRIRLYKF